MKPLVFGCLLVATTLVACDNKIAQCNALIAAMNRADDNLSQPGSDPTALEDVATKLDGAAREVGDVEVKAPELQKFRDDYRDLLRETAEGLRGAAVGAKSGDQAKFQEASKAMLAIGARSGRLVEDINAFCRAK
jgi:hypothetical protein